MRTMSAEEWRSFVMAGTRTGKLATVRADGCPHVAPVWFVLDGEEVVFTTDANTVKGVNLSRTGRAALCVDEETPPFAYVLLEGNVSISSDPGDLLRWATAVGGRYMGANRADEFGRRNGVPGELLVRLRPDKVVALAGIAD
ncbi:MAG: PPOX class F420-dependent oxidoreductase [Dehalococcoidia bacterium]